MPELPEVETTVQELNKKVLGLKIEDVWTDWDKMIKRPKSFFKFKKEIVGQKIEKVERRGKNILFTLSGNKTMLIHQKLTGHLLFGKWKLTKGRWSSLIKGPLGDKTNSYIHLMFYLSSPAKGGVSTMMGFSDLRKFGKVLAINTESLKDLEDIKNLGVEPLAKDFTFEKFKKVLKNKRGKIKQILMDQKVIAGIGNIYSSEILFKAKIYPFKNVLSLSEKELKKIYNAMREILKKAIKVKGESISNYRTLSGEKGGWSKS